MAAEFVSLADRLAGIASFAPAAGDRVDDPPCEPSSPDASGASAVGAQPTNASSNDVVQPELDAAITEAARNPWGLPQSGGDSAA